MNTEIRNIPPVKSPERQTMPHPETSSAQKPRRERRITVRRFEGGKKVSTRKTGDDSDFWDRINAN